MLLVLSVYTDLGCVVLWQLMRRTKPAMSDSLCMSNSVNTVDSSDKMNQQTEADCSLSQLACVLCGTAAASAASCRVKMLPCLHLACHECLVQFLLNNSRPYKEDMAVDFAASIFTCPCCSYTTQLPSGGIVGLKDASFLQTVALLSDVDGKGYRRASMPLLTQPIESGASGDGGLNASARKLSQTFSETDISRLPTCSEPSCTEMLRMMSVNVEGRSVCNHQVVDSSQRRRSHITRLLQDASACRQQCCQLLQEGRFATNDLDTRTAELRRTISHRADELCQLVRSRRDELLSEVDREHAHNSAACADTLSRLLAYTRHVDDSCLFASAVLAATDVSAEVEISVVDRLNQLILCHMPVPGSDTPCITAMRLDVPDTRHEEAHMVKLYGSLVQGIVGTVPEFLHSFTTELQWPTGFTVSLHHDSVLVGKAGAFADEGQVMFFDSHGSCVCRQSTGRLPVDVVSVGTERVLVSDIGGRVTAYSLRGVMLEQWTDVFRGSSGHMAVKTSSNGDDDVLLFITSVADCCVHQYHVNGQRIASITLQWPEDYLNTLVPDITSLAVNSRGEIIITTSNLASSPHFFAADGRYMHSASTTTTTTTG